MDKKIDINMIGKYLKSLRLKKGWSQAKLENITGISASTISNIETGNKGANYHISIQTIITMAYALDITFMQLLSESGFLLALGEEKYKSNKAEIYISNHELINIFNRLDLNSKKELVQTIKNTIEIEDLKKQKQVNNKLKFKKNFK